MRAGRAAALLAALVVPALSARAESLRIATWNAEMNRDGPGLLLRDLLRGDDPQLLAAVQVLAALQADVLLLTGFDYDHGLVALDALADRLGQAGQPYPHRLALAPNTGVPSGFDLDGNGRLGEARDAQGWGRFAGEGGMAILSRLPLDAAWVRDFSALLWRDLPGSLIAPDDPAHAVQRLSTTGHWDVPVILPSGGRLHLLAWHATPPVFDGPEDRNGRRNHDEARFWSILLSGGLPMPPPPAPFVLLGDANLDPADGDGLRAAVAALLADPALQDPAPRGSHGRTEPQHRGDPALDTAEFPPPLGGLRVDLVLPSAGLAITAAGVMWPPGDDPLAAALTAASRHRPVWVDIALP